MSASLIQLLVAKTTVAAKSAGESVLRQFDGKNRAGIRKLSTPEAVSQALRS